MSSITEIKSEYTYPYDVYCTVKNLYMSSVRGVGLELLEHYKFTHNQADMEIFTTYVLYGAFNEMTKQSFDQRLQYSDMSAPAYSRAMIVDMMSLGYPVRQVIRDVDRHHASHLQVPFREHAISVLITKSN